MSEVATGNVGVTGSLAVDAKAAAALFSLGERTWWRLDSAGKIPLGFRVGGRRLWRRQDLERWAAMGFPDRRGFLAETRPETAPGPG